MCHDVFSDLLLGFNLCCQVWEKQDLKCCQSALLYNVTPSSIVFDDDIAAQQFKSRSRWRTTKLGISNKRPLKLENH